MEKQEDKEYFVCRVCGHTEYQKVELSKEITGLDGPPRLMHIFCKNCFAMFKKFEKPPSLKNP